MSTKKQSTSTVNKPYCKVCHDAGKPESVYTSHYVKTSLDANAKIACPTLLALECKYCFQSGHTVKYCSVIKKNEKAKRTEEFKNQQEQKKANPVAKRNPKNAFSSLCESSDDDEEDQVQRIQVLEKEEFPQLNAAKMEKKMQPAPTTLSFASVAYLGQAKEKEEESRRYHCEKEEPKCSYQVIVPEPFLASKMNWADYDTESDNESDF